MFFILALASLFVLIFFTAFFFDEPVGKAIQMWVSSSIVIGTVTFLAVLVINYGFKGGH
jgi:hypothetical protein